MPSLVLNDRLIWFAHCPKTGGTSVENFMVDRWGDAVGHLHWGWDLWWRRGGWREASLPNSPQHLIWSDARHVLPRVPNAIFAMVRDPAARMASEYRWQRGARRGTRLGKALALLPFSIWLRLMLELARQNPHAYDNHFRPQSEFIPEGARVFRLEDGLAPALDWLTETVGEPKPSERPPHRLATRAVCPLTPMDQARIAAVYAYDYARFGYQVPEGPVRSDLVDRLARIVAPALAWFDRRGAL